jgi:hypothetical protein
MGRVTVFRFQFTSKRYPLARRSAPGAHPNTGIPGYENTGGVQNSKSKRQNQNAKAKIFDI